jgi:hypothetical protein
MANPLDLEPELIPFASPEERQLLASRALGADDEQAMLVELRKARNTWLTTLNPTKEQLLAVTHEENRMHARSGSANQQFWDALDADWRRKQEPTAEDVFKARNPAPEPPAQKPQISIPDHPEISESGWADPKPISPKPESPEKSKGVNIFDLAKRISDQANSEEGRSAVDGLRKLAESLRADEESFRQKLADMAKPISIPQDYGFPEIDTRWQEQLAEQTEARRKAETEEQHRVIVTAVREAFREAEDRAQRNREMENMGRRHSFTPIDGDADPSLPLPEKTENQAAPSESFLEFHKNAQGEVEIRPYPPPESAEDRRLRKREELLRREESLEVGRRLDEHRREMSQFYSQAGFTPVSELRTEPSAPKTPPKPRWFSRKALRTFVGTVVIVLGLVAAALAAAGVVKMGWTHLFLFFAWVVSVAGVCVGEGFEDKTAQEIIRLGCITALLSGLVLFGVDRLIAKEKAEADSKNSANSSVSPMPSTTFASQVTQPSPSQTPTPSRPATKQTKGNPFSGTVTLRAGQPTTVLTTAVTAASKIQLLSVGESISGSLHVTNIVPGVSFDIYSDNGADSGNVAWTIYP